MKQSSHCGFIHAYSWYLSSLFEADLLSIRKVDGHLRCLFYIALFAFLRIQIYLATKLFPFQTQSANQNNFYQLHKT